MNKYVIYGGAIFLDLMLMSLINIFPILSLTQTIPVNTFFFIVLLHTHHHTINIKEIIVLFFLGLGLDVFYVTPLFVNAVSLIIVVIIAHQLKTYFDDNDFERIVFLVLLLSMRELFNYAILFVTLKTSLNPTVWFSQRVFFILILNIPWMILSVFVFSKYQHIEKINQKRRRQKETYINYR
jgi:rod shape-determining protein MreD